MGKKKNVKFVLIICLVLFSVAKASDSEEKIWKHPCCKRLPTDMKGPFVNLSDGSVLAIGNNQTFISNDEGENWSEIGKIYDGPKPGIPKGGVVVKTRDGVIVLVYMDMSTIIRTWVDGEPAEDIQLDVWSIRSFDQGKTWVDRQMIFDGYCGAIINIIQTSDGHIVAPIEHPVRNPGRHVTQTLVSADNGLTWKLSNIIDLGGAGDHDGAMEGTVVELKDGRLYMLMRTNLDRFWHAYSEDKGLSWRIIKPSDIDASSAPGYMKRLASGRLVLVWNRLYPEGKDSYYRPDKRQHFHNAPSYQRAELSIAFSEDEGQTWTRPVVFAKVKGSEQEQVEWMSVTNGLCYPYIFERKPGLLWITTGCPRKENLLRISIRETDFVCK